MTSLPRQLVVGLGSGRSGTVSLARFLDAQPQSYFVHEGAYGRRFFKYFYGHLLPWQPDLHEFEVWDAGLKKAAGGARFYGDVAFFLLPYVPHILARHPDARFICLKRDRTEVVRSFMAKTAGVNHFMEHDGTVWKHDRWDAMFPTFAAPSKESAIGMYWDAYYAQAEEYAGLYPGQFKLFPTDTLNSPEGRHALLDFAGFPQESREVAARIHANRHIPAPIMFVARRLASLLRI